jgi:hypothetical protein
VGDKLTRHHPEAPRSLRKDVAMYVAIVVLARPDESTRRLDHLCDHIVNHTVLVVNTGRLEPGLGVRPVDLLEDVLESPIVLLHDSVFGRHEQRHLLRECHLEGRVSKANDRLRVEG